MRIVATAFLLSFSLLTTYLSAMGLWLKLLILVRLLGHQCYVQQEPCSPLVHTRGPSICHNLLVKDHIVSPEFCEMDIILNSTSSTYFVCFHLYIPAFLSHIHVNLLD